MEQMEALIADLGKDIVRNRTLDIMDYQDVIQQSFKSAHNRLKDMLEQAVPSEQIKNCIHYFQLEVSSLLCKTDLLMSSIERTPSPPGFKKAYKEVLWTVICKGVKLLDFMRAFPIFFDGTMAVPDVLHAFYLKGIHKRWFRCREIFKARASPLLIEPLDGYFKKCRCGITSEKLRWQDIGYMELLSQELEWLVIRENPKDFQSDLVNCLFRLNFNHPDFFSYNIARIGKDMHQLDTYLQEQREWLDFQREINSMLVRKDVGYDLRLKDIKTQLCDYINDQIRYAKKKQKLHRSNLFIKWERAVTPFYFHVSLTVVQLIFFFKLMVEAGVIVTKSRKDLNEFLVNHVGTLRKDNISIKSIQSKYIRPDRKVVDKISGILIVMLNILNAKYKNRIK